MADDSHASQRAHKKQRKSRGRGLRTTSGCLVCRKRHMKCDEVKPTCTSCVKSGRACSYDDTTKCIIWSDSGAFKLNFSWCQINDPLQVDDAFTDSESTSHLDYPLVNISPPLMSRDDHNPHAKEKSPLVTDITHSIPLDVPAPQSANENAVARNVSEHGFSQPQDISYNEIEETTSPQSTRSFAFYPPDVAPLRWFGLLTDDANDLLNGMYMRDSNITQLANPSRHTSIIEELASPSVPCHFDFPHTSGPITLAPFGHALSPQPIHSLNPVETRPWQASTGLKEHEIPIFRHFVDHLSIWIDVFDPLQHFQTFVPQLAMQNEGLMKAILALSARHISLKPAERSSTVLDRTVAVRYYAETLQYLQGAMKYNSYKNSLELIATTLIVSTYEMLDGHASGWDRHLKGIFWILRSQDIDGQSGGLRQAVWWACRRQDVWAAFRERRMCYSFYKPTLPYDYLTPFDIAARATYILSQVVNYSSDTSCRTGAQDLQTRINEGQFLTQMLDDWQAAVTIHFRPLPLERVVEKYTAFESIWINPPAFAAAVQTHSFARILLLANQPAIAGYREFIAREKTLSLSINTICGIAKTIKDEAACVISTQCVFAAGLYATDEGRRREILQIIDQHQELTGWPCSSLSDELKTEWAAPPCF